MVPPCFDVVSFTLSPCLHRAGEQAKGEMNWRIQAGFADYGGYLDEGIGNSVKMYLSCFEFAINSMVMGYGVTYVLKAYVDDRKLRKLRV